MSARITLTILAAAFGFCPLTASAEKTGAKRGGYVGVRTYLPQGYITDGSVDYREQIQKCFDENAYIYFPGSDDPAKPMVYVNGRHVGAHDGNAAWDEPFHFDVTDVVRTGDNDLTLRIEPDMNLGGPFRPISVIVP